MPDSDYSSLPEDMGVFSKFYIPTDDIMIANDTPQNTASATYVKLKEIQLLFSINQVSVFRLKFDLSHVGGTAYGRIYKNGVAIGTERINSGTYIEELSASDWKRNDLIQLFAYNEGGGTTTVGSFRICGAQSEFVNTIGM